MSSSNERTIPETTSSTRETPTINYEISTAPGDMEPDRCAVLYALDIVGQKWKLPILWHLHAGGTVRYNELRRQLSGVTNMMLAKSLKELEASGLITRTQYQTIPPKVEYALAKRGEQLLPALNALYKWGEEQKALDEKKSR